MRKYLNNPRVVLPFALFALLWGLHSYGLLEDLLPEFSGKPKPGVQPVASREENMDMNIGGQVMQSLTRQQWLPRNWEQYSAIRKEPFVANYSFEKEVAPEIEEQAEPLIEETVVVDPDMLDSYIAKHIGLDERGFFVSFGVIRKRNGDSLRTTRGTDLVVGTIAVAERSRTAEEHAELVRSTLARLRLSGVMGLDSDVLDQVDAGALETVENGFREGDTVNLRSVNTKQKVNIESSAVIYGGRNASDFYKQGDLVTVEPALGLAKVYEGAVSLVDRYGETFILPLD